MQPAPPPTPFHLPSPDITPLSSLSSSSPSSASLSSQRVRVSPMSASPQPPPPPPALRDDPAPHQPNGISSASSSSPAQLAALLTKSLQEAEALKDELATVRRRAEKAERLLATFQSSQSPSSNASPPGSSQGQPAKSAQLPESARKAILEFENRAERAEQARDEAEARLRLLQESWLELDRFLAQMELRNADARAQFARIVADAGGPLVPVSSIPSQNTVYLPTALQQQQQQQQHIQLPPLPAVRSHPPVRPRVPMSTQPFPSVTLPPPPSASSSRVRPRAGSMDAAYNGVLTGPGAPPPSKRPRNDRDAERSRDRHYSLSVSVQSVSLPCAERLQRCCTCKQEACESESPLATLQYVI